MAKHLHTLVKSNNTDDSSVRSDEGIILETSFHGVNSTFINSFDKTKL